MILKFFKSLFSRTPHVNMPLKNDSTRLVCLVSSAVTIFFSIITFICYLFKLVPADSFIFWLAISVLSLISWKISSTNYWKFARFFLPAIVFIIAVYGNIIGGPSAPSLILYIFSVILTAILINEKIHFIVAFLSIVSYGTIYLLTIKNIFITQRTLEDFFLVRIFIVTGTFICVSLILKIFIYKYLNVLLNLDNYSKELLKKNEDLSQINGRLQKEIEERSALEKEKDEFQKEALHFQKVNAAGFVTSGIAHDLNNYLTSISGLAEMTLLHKNLDDEVKGNISQIVDVLNKSAALTGRLLDINRKKTIAPTKLDLNLVIQNLEIILKSLLKENVAINMNLDDKIDPIVADKNYIEQAIINLAINARDAMPSGGKLSLNTGCYWVNHDDVIQKKDLAPGKYTFVSVEDTGTGMDENVRKHLFEPFFTTKEIGKGTGLGLSTVKFIVNQYRGHVSIISEKDNGTKVKLFFPVNNDDKD